MRLPTFPIAVTDMDVIETFMRWWNTLAQRNGKLKFKTQREAAEFVRRVQNEHGGPNAKMLAMRQRYVEAIRTRETRSSSGFGESEHQTVHR
jgi:hypothetical protein